MQSTEAKGILHFDFCILTCKHEPNCVAIGSSRLEKEIRVNNTMDAPILLEFAMHKLTAFCLFALLIACQGCRQADVKDYIPPDEAARQALTAALDAWKSGKTPDQIRASQPAINVQDQRWTAGKKLAAYEIVAAAKGDDDHRRYAVKLTIEGAEPQEATYVVFGKDPLWVVSGESYQRMSGM